MDGRSESLELSKNTIKPIKSSISITTNIDFTILLYCKRGAGLKWACNQTPVRPYLIGYMIEWYVLTNFPEMEIVIEVI